MSERRPGDSAASQRERILSWALAGYVLHQDDWYSRGADGGPPIKAVRSRIPELEAMGYGFDHTTRLDRTMEYRLRYSPDPERAAAATPESLVSVSEVDDVEEPRQLFDPPPAAALRCPMFDWEDVA
jgi:hypothetical protein